MLGLADSTPPDRPLDDDEVAEISDAILPGVGLITSGTGLAETLRFSPSTRLLLLSPLL